VAEVREAALVARIGGVLRALSARGTRVLSAQVVAEFDARGDADLCACVDGRAMRLANAVVATGGARLCAMPPSPTRHHPVTNAA
jgi:hypothetical protein